MCCPQPSRFSDLQPETACNTQTDPEALEASQFREQVTQAKAGHVSCIAVATNVSVLPVLCYWFFLGVVTSSRR